MRDVARGEGMREEAGAAGTALGLLRLVIRLRPRSTGCTWLGSVSVLLR